MKVLLLSYFFSPDLRPGAFRATALAKALREVNSSLEVDVVTTMPNDNGSLPTVATANEAENGVVVRRIELPVHKSGLLDQSLAFWAYARQAQDLVREEHYDLVFATSGRLMTALLGAWIATKKRAPLYLDIRDIFVESIRDILPRGAAFFAAPVFDVLERWAINRASKVNLVSHGFADYFESRYPHQGFSFFTNGIDDEFLNSQPVDQQLAKKSFPLRILYAGNIGVGQGLDLILPKLGKRLHGQAIFRVVGEGGRKELLRDALQSARVTNVELLPRMPRSQLIEEYKRADVLFIHLNNYDAFKRSLPSKIFEYAAMGKPILAGLPGYSAEFVRTEVSNSAVFPPCDFDRAVQALDSLAIRDMPREEFVHKFSRSNICRRLANDILSIAKR